MQIRMVQRVILRGGPSYMPGEVVGFGDDEALSYVERGLAEFLPSEPAPRQAEVPASDRPPADKMLRRGDAVRK